LMLVSAKVRHDFDERGYLSSGLRNLAFDGCSGATRQSTVVSQPMLLC
jgi:hypothetical protein